MSIPDLKPTQRKVPMYYPWMIDPTLPVGDLFTAEGIKVSKREIPFFRAFLVQLFQKEVEYRS